LLDGEADALTRKAIELAKEGDTTALRLCIERILPARKDRPVTCHELRRSPDSVKTAAAIATAVADGELTPMEAAELCKVRDAYGGNSGLGRPFGAARMRTIERRLRKLEQVTHRPIAFVWLDQQNEAELRAEIAEREAICFRVVKNVSSLNCRATVRIIRISMVNKIRTSCWARCSAT
jgi:hypothetical protein